MIMKYGIIPLIGILTVSMMVPVFGETYNIAINEDSFDKACVPNCLEPQVITIEPDDTVTWTNHETDSTRNHGFISGNPVDGPDGGPLDSGTIRPGESFSYTFNSPGQYDYYDMAKPWIQGSIIVGTIVEEVEVEIETENGTEIIKETKEIEPVFEQKPDRQVIHDSLLESLYPKQTENIRQIINVGLNIDADNVHTVNYIFDKDISGSQIQLNESGNTLGFGFKEPVTGTIVLKMPDALIGKTTVVINQDSTILPHTYSDHDNHSIVEIEMTEPTRVITIGATYVIPEYMTIFTLITVFGTMVCIVFVLGKKHPMLSTI